jgi:CheY-like chemotaxis protein
MVAPKRILVVDDNLILRTLVAHALEDAGYVAVTAESGEAALELARIDPPDLFLVDYLMPGMTGADLIRELRRSPDARLRRVPAIGLSAIEGSEQEMIAAGANGALRKPCEEAPLLEQVRSALGASR